MPLTLGLSILVSGAFGTVHIAAIPAAQPVHEVRMQTQNQSMDSAIAAAVMASPPDPEVQKAVDAYFADIPIMITIADCESKFHQYDSSGSVLKSATDDLGVMQINVPAHQSEAAGMGYNLADTTDNMAFARYLYEHQGTTPWLSSAHCWNQQNDTAVVDSTNQPLAVHTTSE